MTSKDGETQSTAIVCVEATPANFTKKETRALSIFKAVLSYIQSKMGLAEDFARAKTRREETEAEVKIEEASKIAAETERTRLETLRGRIELVDSHFTEMAKDEKLALKLAVLFRDNPQLEAQMELVSRMMSDLREKRGLRIELRDDNDKPET